MFVGHDSNCHSPHFDLFSKENRDVGLSIALGLTFLPGGSRLNQLFLQKSLFCGSGLRKTLAACASNQYLINQPAHGNLLYNTI